MIRRAQPDDADWIRVTAAHVYAPLGDYGTIIPAWMDHPGVMTFVEHDQVRRGFILVGFYDPQEPHRPGRPAHLVADLLAIAVAPEHQRRGVGSQLLLFAIDLATEAALESLPVRELRLTVADTNAPARALFTRHGFLVLDEHHGAYDGGQRAIRMGLHVARR
jgi:ribosomal protein S18 acetylase RimI-like enzyme